MQAIFCARRRNRIAVRTDYGFIAAEAIDDCEFDMQEPVAGVSRDHGTQFWTGAGGRRCEVYVEAIDASADWVTGWLAGA